MAEQQTVDGAKIRLLRVQKDWSAEELAKQSELSTTYIYKIEKGEATPSIPVLNKIADALSVDISELFTPGVNIEATEPMNQSELKKLRHMLVHSSMNTAKTDTWYRLFNDSFKTETERQYNNVPQKKDITLLIETLREFMGPEEEQRYRSLRDDTINTIDFVISISKYIQLRTDDEYEKDVLLMIMSIFMQAQRRQ